MPVMCYNERMKRIAMYITEQQRKLLKAMSEQTGLTMAELVRRAIDEFLARIKR
jgi:predicted DNA-binding protein